MLDDSGRCLEVGLAGSLGWAYHPPALIPTAAGRVVLLGGLADGRSGVGQGSLLWLSAYDPRQHRFRRG